MSSNLFRHEEDLQPVVTEGTADPWDRYPQQETRGVAEGWSSRGRDLTGSNGDPSAGIVGITATWQLGKLN